MSERRWLAGLVLALLGVCPAGARGDELEFRGRRDGVITGVAGAAYLLGTVVFADALAPEACRWCAGNRLDDGVRDGLRWADPGRAATLSDVAAYGVVPAAAFGLTALVAQRDGRLAGTLTDAGLILEAVAITGCVTTATKFAVGRERPFVHALPPDQRAATADPGATNLSFFSGHTSWAFSFAASSGTVASLRGYRHAWAVWAVGLTAAAATGYLRIAADKHYASDVLVGAAVGSAIGVAVPVWFGRRASPERLAVVVHPTGLGLVGRF